MLSSVIWPTTPCSSLMLYGSHSRGDQTPDSDIDLLSLTAARWPGSHAIGHVRLSTYPTDLLERMALDGSLFVWHLAEEGKIVLDDNDILKAIIAKFTFGQDYSGVRAEAAELGWLLVQQPDLRLGPAACDALLFVIRTIALCDLVARRSPCFSRDAMTREFGDPRLSRLWDAKRGTALSTADGEILMGFLRDHGGPVPTWVRPSPIRPPLSRLSPVTRAKVRKILEVGTGAADIRESWYHA
jgi:hypothetical protein